MPRSKTPRGRQKKASAVASEVCLLIGHVCAYGGAVALALVSAFAFSEWSGYGPLVLATYGSASAGCIALGLVLRGCARLLRPAVDGAR